MFYKPRHCCECGEKIEREKWKWSTSRRFCETCESDFKLQDWLWRGIIGLGVLGMLFGIGSSLKNSEKPLNVATTQIAPLASNKNQNLQNSPVSVKSDVLPATQKPTEGNIPIVEKRSGQETNLDLKARQAKQKSLEKQQNSALETVYFCGAQTKKGTPCTRRVRGGGRCWQHLGQPAMLAPEKLVASQ